MNPCCCSLQTGTRVVAILQIIGSVAGLILAVVGLIHLKQILDEQGKSLPGTEIAVLAFAIILIVLALILGVVLLIGANNRDVRKCKIWFNVMLVITILSVVNIIFAAFTPEGLNAQGIANVLFNFYFLWVVHAFMEEIKGDPTSSLTA